MATSNRHVLPHTADEDRHQVESHRCNSTDSSRSTSIAGKVIFAAIAALPSTATAAAAVLVNIALSITKQVSAAAAAAALSTATNPAGSNKCAYYWKEPEC